MNTNLRPAVVRTFMTHEMTDADIVAVSTGREEEFGRIIAAVSRSRSATPGALQHVVLYGSRGFGKSFMMRRVEIALQQTPPDNKPITFLLLPEEQHNLQKSPHAFLDYITVLLTKTEGDEAFAEAMFQWPKPDEAARRWKESAAKLEAALDVALPDGKGLVIVAVENFDSLLKTLFANNEDEQRLRDWLFRQKNRVMLLATATGTVDMDYDKPLFQAFESVRLQPWTTDDCITYFNRKRESEGKSPLDGRQEAKARAVAEFIGGTPRLAQLLAEVIETEDALTVAETMNALADRLAEYYRRRIEDLAPLVRGLLDALIRGGEPASQTQLAERVGAQGQSQIARAMSDLQTADIIRGRPAPDSRETLYAVTDRVFAHYYRRRQGSRVAQETPLASILDFLRSFYDRTEQKEQGLRHLLEGRLAEGALFSRLAMEEDAHQKDDYLDNCENWLINWLDLTESDFGEFEYLVARLRREPEKILSDFPAGSGNSPIDLTISYCMRSHALYQLGHAEQAEAELRRILHEIPDNSKAQVIARIELIMFFLVARNDFELLTESSLVLSTLDFSSFPARVRAQVYRILAWWLEKLERHEEALAHLAQAIDLSRMTDNKSEEATDRTIAGSILNVLNRNEEALAQLIPAIELALETGNKEQEMDARHHLGYALDVLNRHEEALTQWQKAIELAREIGDKSSETHARRFAGWSLGDLNRHEEALEQWKQVAALALDFGSAYDEGVARKYAGRSLAKLKRYSEALAQLKTSIELSRKSNNNCDLCWSICFSLDSALHVPTPEICSMYKEWIRKFDEKSEDSFPDPRLSISDLLITSAISGSLSEFDQLMSDHGRWLASKGYVYLSREHGEIVAKISENDRAVGWQIVANLLPRAALLQMLAPEEYRDDKWLSQLIAGFAEKCHNPGLLRDVAALLTPELSPEAEQAATLLMELASIDEAEDPHRLLARMNPDRALLIRRLRDLPDPEQPRPAKSSKRKHR